MNVPQVLVRDMRIKLSGADVGMAEYGLDGSEVNTVIE